MTPRPATWKHWLAIATFLVVSVSMAAAWRQTHQAQQHELAAQSKRLLAQTESIRTQTEKLANLESQVELLTGETEESLRDQNHDLMLFADEIYKLLYKAGLHVQLAFDKAPDGRFRMKADSLKVTDELRAKLQQLQQLQLPPDSER